MLLKNVLTLTAVVLTTSQAVAKDAKQIITLGQKSRLTQLCLEGKFNRDANNMQLVNSVLGSNIQGDGGGGAPQGSLVISDGKGKYALVDLGNNGFGSSEPMKKGDNIELKRTGSVSEVSYEVTLVEQGSVSSTELIVTDYSTGMGNSEPVQFCRVGTVSNRSLKDVTANTIMEILAHRDIFSQTKTKEAAKATLEKVAKTGRNKLNEQEFNVLKELLFGELRSQDNSEAAKISSSLYEYATDVRSKESLAKEQSTAQVEYNSDWNTRVSSRANEVNDLKLNYAAMKAATLKVGFEVIGKKAMFVGENDLVADNNYRASGAKTHSLLRLVKDKRALDILIVK